MFFLKQLIAFVAAVWLASTAILGWGAPALANRVTPFQILIPSGLLASMIEPTQGKISQPAQLTNQLCTNTAQKIDLNNANLVDFMDCPGFYPTLARSIVEYGPYARTEDVLKIADLSDQQKQLLSNNLSSFTVSDPVIPIEMRMPPRPSMRANP